MADKNLILVKTVKKIPCLYNHHLPEYFKREITERTRKPVGNETKMTVNECKEKWKNLRYSFIRCLKVSRHGSTKKQYYLKDEMEYVLPYVRALPSILTGSVTSPVDSDPDEDIIENKQHILSLEQEDINKTQNIHEPQQKKIKASTEFTNNNHLQTALSSHGINEEARKMFLLSLLPEVAELSESQMRRFRRKVLELLDDISLETTISARNENELDLRNTEKIDIVKNEPL